MRVKYIALFDVMSQEEVTGFHVSGCHFSHFTPFEDNFFGFPDFICIL